MLLTKLEKDTTLCSLIRCASLYFLSETRHSIMFTIEFLLMSSTCKTFTRIMIIIVNTIGAI